MRADPETKTAVNEVLEKMADAIAQKNITAFMKLFAEDPNMMTIDIDKGRFSLGTHQLKKHMEEFFQEVSSVSLKYGWTGIGANGPVAWVGSHVTYNIKKKGKAMVNLSTCLSGVMEKKGDKWLWVHQHLSVPVPFEAPDEEEPEEPEKESENLASEQEGSAAPTNGEPSDMGDGFYDLS